MKKIGILFLTLIALSGCQELIAIGVSNERDLVFTFDKRYRVCEIQLYSANFTGELFNVDYSDPIWESSADNCSNQKKINQVDTSKVLEGHKVFSKSDSIDFSEVGETFFEILIQGEPGKSGGLRFKCLGASCMPL